MNAPCGYMVWQERQWPHQWIGQCNRMGCPGGIRCNSEADATVFKAQMPCVALRERTDR